jgi:16S rRNA (guanine(966)-N(2))-methyltransferase RsmD
MQLTGGQFKGRKVEATDEVRPTLAKVRESVFNILRSELGDFEGLTFLDMFSGSAIMALEAASRGFSVTAIEKVKTVSKIAQKNIEMLQMPVNLITTDALRLTPKLGSFDVIYIDPPWEYEYNEIITLAAQKLRPDGVLVCEYDGISKKKQPAPEGTTKWPSNVKLFKEKTYGRCAIRLFALEN